MERNHPQERVSEPRDLHSGMLFCPYTKNWLNVIRLFLPPEIKGRLERKVWETE
jgi:hypothetical protein